MTSLTGPGGDEWKAGKWTATLSSLYGLSLPFYVSSPTICPYGIWTSCMVARGSPNCNIGSCQPLGRKPRWVTASLLPHLVNSSEYRDSLIHYRKNYPMVWIWYSWFLWGPSLGTSYWFIQGPLMMFQPNATKMTFIGNKSEMLHAITLGCSQTSASNGHVPHPNPILSVCKYLHVPKALTE